ncbi:hypothetical protein EYF80_060660 [Liparis tanakae]|uniref:Uncharacterized protein n=1 Tax=Liparis tanakae TaxID=230148 RepID=A0A4Z2EKT7_9TELE|nr:hypothetical protein EYF80_060660 [Liparis tanakae]
MTFCILNAQVMNTLMMMLNETLKAKTATSTTHGRPGERPRYIPVYRPEASMFLSLLSSAVTPSAPVTNEH